MLTNLYARVCLWCPEGFSNDKEPRNREELSCCSGPHGVLCHVGGVWGQLARWKASAARCVVASAQWLRTLCRTGVFVCGVVGRTRGVFVQTLFVVCCCVVCHVCGAWCASAREFVLVGCVGYQCALCARLIRPLLLNHRLRILPTRACTDFKWLKLVSRGHKYGMRGGGGGESRYGGRTTD